MKYVRMKELPIGSYIKIFIGGRASGKSLLHEDENGNVYISPHVFENDNMTPLEAYENEDKQKS